MMNIRCICLVRDEVDVLGHTLDGALRWAHTIYVIDNGSSDGSWELLQAYTKRYPQVVLVGRDYGGFRNSLRGEVVNSVIRDAKKGDWWCRLDADEIYVDNPREFLPRIAPPEKIVWSVSIQYYFTDVDLAAYERDPSEYVERWKPERLRFYQANWSEPRFVRHVPGMEWSDEWPRGFYQMRAARERIRLRHYQYRSPPQIEQRLRLRLQTAKGFQHEKTQGWLVGGLRKEDLAFPDVAVTDPEPWRSRVIRAVALDQDDGKGEYRLDWALLPRMWGRESLLRRALLDIRQRWQRTTV